MKLLELVIWLFALMEFAAGAIAFSEKNIGAGIACWFVSLMIFAVMKSAKEEYD